ncbi:MAG: hypothetical protein WAO51_07970 [Bacillota bacterium]
MEHYFTHIEESKRGFVVSTINPYRILCKTGSRKTAELCQGAVEAAIDTLTAEYPGEGKPHRRLMPKLGVLPGGRRE